MSDSYKIKPIYNCKELYIWPMTDEDTETYGDPVILKTRLMTYDDSVSPTSTDFYGDGEVVLVDVDEGKGTLAIGLHGLKNEEMKKIFSMIESGTTIKTYSETGEEVPPYCCVALMAQRGKTVVNLRKWPKVRFQKMQESVQQKTQQRTYSTPTLTGEFIKCERLGYKRARAEVDLSTEGGAAFKTAWYANADYYYEGQTVQGGTNGGTNGQTGGGTNGGTSGETGGETGGGSGSTGG